MCVSKNGRSCGAARPNGRAAEVDLLLSARLRHGWQHICVPGPLVQIVRSGHQSVQVNVPGRQLILSERAAYMSDFVQTLKKGDVVEGVISKLTDFGAFLSMKGADGALHGSEVRRAHAPSSNCLTEGSQPILLIEDQGCIFQPACGAEHCRPDSLPARKLLLWLLMQFFRIGYLTHDTP